ncbi:MAG: desulfoferrodoxin Dfx [Erysipelotrichaceae bacterium]|nr:desulfoferrodoxin Dfx [Erysipelotrichaceae bacterium]MBQ2214000.1 desulfoferrodoxin Dfx [Erysipelotrichaceae bacterium]MBQ2684699.1 desulfoferrodoxin Dfx [Erysipelotrichaceae bacterium]MBR3352373.1 desulfoferrodoxin Dfx [Erysipelotrichaceae bacterium]
MAVKVLRCEGCGKMVLELKGSKCPTKCCGEPMVELVPNTTDGAHEKHVPVIEKDGNKVTVKVGSVAHPMLAAHYIEFIILETNKTVHLANLTPENEPCAEFVLAEGEEVVAAYEYCNLHGFWKA